MKRIILAIILLSVFLIADSQKYDFEIEININQKSLEDIPQIIEDLQEFATKHNATFNIKLDNERYSNQNIWNGLELLPNYPVYVEDNIND